MDAFYLHSACAASCTRRTGTSRKFNGLRVAAMPAPVARFTAGLTF